MKDERELWIKQGEFTYDTVNGYNHTKVLDLTINKGDEQLPLPEQPTTWASLLRLTIRVLEEYIQGEVDADESTFRDRFNFALRSVIETNGLKSNTSFSEELFTEPTHIKSNVYRNNKNSMCKIYDIPDSTESKYITAVYSGEVVWVLNALVYALKDYDISIVVRYIDREDLKALVEETDDEPQEEIEEIKGNANLYVSLLRLKIDEIYSKYNINEEDYKQMMKWIDNLALTIIETKLSTISIIKLLTDLDIKLGN